MIIKGLLLGLSTGVVCLGCCLPFLFSLLLIDNNNSFLSRFRIIFEFLMGRLLAYISLGAIIGYLGQALDRPLINMMSGITILILSLLMISYAFIKGWNKKCRILRRIFPEKNFPAIVGFFTGFNICPPFLLAITYSFSLTNMIRGLSFFIVFFAATSLYFIPFLFIGYFSKYEQIRLIAQMFTILAGIFFFLSGLRQILVIKATSSLQF